MTPEIMYLIFSARAYVLGMPAPVPPDSLDLMELLRLAQQHRFLSFAAASLLQHGMDGAHREQRLHLFAVDARDIALYRAREKVKVATQLQEELLSQSIPCIIRKGAFLDTKLYGGRGLREYSDIDLYIPSCLQNEALIAARKFTFRSGWYDTVRSAFLPTSRLDEIRYKMTPDHLPPMYQVRETDPLLPAIKLDFCFDLAWAKHPDPEPYKLILEEAFLPSSKKSTSSLSPPRGQEDLAFHFIDVAMHIYREANFYRDKWVNGLAGVRLPKFVDVALLFRRMSDVERRRLLEWCHSADSVREVVSWVLYHTDQVIGGNLHDEAGLEHNKECAQALFPVVAERRDWDGNMIQRLFAPDSSDVLQ